MSSPQHKPLILLCDGTWCGRETSTKTNIYELAKLVGVSIGSTTDVDEHFIPPNNTGKEGRYIHGVGLGSTFLDYIFNGITAQDIAEQCIAAYKYIVENYVEGEHEIWMFGLSRGAYTVRCVAGMINNCGIIKPNNLTDVQRDLLCREVYRIYRSPYKIDKPHSRQSLKFREYNSWPLIGDENVGQSRRKAPVRFMGLFDTVGSLGIPTFTGGVGLDWPKFYSEHVSSVVEHVSQTVSLHDRFYIFQPCLATRDPEKYPDPTTWNIDEKWLPGVHYDLGRQRFEFFRDGGGGLLERILAGIEFISKVIEPNHVLADLALKSMLESIQAHDSQSIVVSDVVGEINAIRERIVADNRKTGDGDVYNKITSYAPFGDLATNVWKAISGSGGRPNAIYELLFALRDRHIPDDGANVYQYQEIDKSISERVTIQTLAGIDELTGNRAEDEKKRYPSKAFESWILRKRARL